MEVEAGCGVGDREAVKQGAARATLHRAEGFILGTSVLQPPPLELGELLLHFGAPLRGGHGGGFAVLPDPLLWPVGGLDGLSAASLPEVGLDPAASAWGWRLPKAPRRAAAAPARSEPRVNPSFGAAPTQHACC